MTRLSNAHDSRIPLGRMHKSSIAKGKKGGKVMDSLLTCFVTLHEADSFDGFLFGLAVVVVVPTPGVPDAY